MNGISFGILRIIDFVKNKDNSQTKIFLFIYRTALGQQLLCLNFGSIGIFRIPLQ